MGLKDKPKEDSPCNKFYTSHQSGLSPGVHWVPGRHPMHDGMLTHALYCSRRSSCSCRAG